MSRALRCIVQSLIALIDRHFNTFLSNVKSSDKMKIRETRSLKQTISAAPCPLSHLLYCSSDGIHL
jgi:hypothetical protein